MQKNAMQFLKELAKKYATIRDYAKTYTLAECKELLDNKWFNGGKWGIREVLTDMIYSIVDRKMPLYYDEIYEQFMIYNLFTYSLKDFNVEVDMNKGVMEIMQDMLFYYYRDEYMKEVNDIIRDIKDYKNM